MADARDEGFELIPIDDPDISPDKALNAATASALDDPEAPSPIETVGPEPFGYSWAFDWAAGRFKRQGMQPARVSGFDALREWCMMAVNSTRLAHAVFSDEFGMDDPREGLGGGIGDDDDLASDYEDKIREALMIHDRIVDVTDFDTEWNPLAGVLTINTFSVVTDEGEELPFDDIELTEEA